MKRGQFFAAIAVLSSFLLIPSFASAEAAVAAGNSSVISVNEEISAEAKQTSSVNPDDEKASTQVLTASWIDVNGVKRTVTTNVYDIASAIPVHIRKVERDMRRWPPRG